MIPGDLATRLRALVESSVQPLTAVHEIGADLSAFEQGQRFTAQLLSPLPDGTFRALVAGKTMTLALPDSAKSGDVLELIVTEQRGSTVFARADAAASSAAEQTPRPVLSQTGQLISQLLTGRFGTVEPTPLSSGAPLLPNPPANAQELTPVLQQAVSKSGVFYEAHLRDWVQGKLPLEAIRQEPQAMLGSATQASPAQAPAQQALIPTVPLTMLVQAQMPVQLAAMSLAQATQPKDISSQQADEEPLEPPADEPSPIRRESAFQSKAVRAYGQEAMPTRTSLLAEHTAVQRQGNEQIPDRVLPLVHQQLEMLATQQVTWQGQVWPGMNVEWEIFNPERDGNRSAESEEPVAWRSALRLSLPQLGEINAQLILGTEGITVRLDTNSTQAAERMRGAQLELASALEAAGLKILGMTVSERADT